MSDLDDRGYRRYWDEARERADPAERERAILERVRAQLDYVYRELPFYRRLYDEARVRVDEIRSLEDFATKIPVVTKKMLVEDQACHPPFGSYAGSLEPSDIARIQGSSGTKGAPTLYRVSLQDWERAAEVSAMAQWAGGVRPDDVLQISFPFSLFFGGWGVLQGAERLGAATFPLGAIDSDRQLDLMSRVSPTVFAATPSYALHVAGVARDRGIDLRPGSVRRLIVGGEPGGSLSSVRDLLHREWGIDCVIDGGSTSEMYPFMTNTSCEAEAGVHLFTDEVYTEVVDVSDPNVPMPMESRGAVVYTHLWRRSQPMIRFWSGDESYMTDEPCPCGRTYPRLPEGVLGRIDDMLVIRGGNVYPSMIDGVVREFSELGPEFRIVVDKHGALDELTVEVEWGPEGVGDLGTGGSEQEAALRQAIGERLQRVSGLRMGVEVLRPGTLPATVFKASRVVDRRPGTR